MRTILLAVFFVLFAALARAGSFEQSGRGTDAATFLELGVGGRAMGMGGAYTAVADDATALYWNPAGLAQVEKRAATFMHAAYLESTFYDYAAYAQNAGKLGAFGAGFQYLNAGEIAQTDAAFNEVGKFTPNDLSIAAGWAHALPGGGAGGVAVKYIRSEILTSAQTAAVDFGLLTPWVLKQQVRLGAAVTNVGGTLKFMETRENLPLTLRSGGEWKVNERWIWALDLVAPRDSGGYVDFGTEYLLPVKDAWSFAARAGYSSQTTGEVTGFTGLSLGIGLANKGLSFDYAFVPYGGLGVTSRFSLSAKF
jgi:hypothetical protein